MNSEVINSILKVLQATHVLSARRLASLRYRYKFHRWPDIDNPQDLNEKVLALMFRTDTARWSDLADKYEVRKYVEDKGLGHLLPRLYGVYDNADDVDFEHLPDKCVVKSTNGCGYVLIYDGDKRPDPEEARRKVNQWLHASYGYITAEPHYTRIRPRVIVEELIEKAHKEDSSLIDYKIWCANGVPLFVFACTDRDIEGRHARFGFYTIPDWEPCPQFMHESNGEHPDIPRPGHLAEMVEYARRLSESFPLVRVDFYESEGVVLFGEMTFSSNGGRMRYFTDEMLSIYGDKVDLSQVEFLN